ncbi:MAG: LuxR C-terminal-related transcriptional regulator [Mucilaginibacter sp.]
MEIKLGLIDGNDYHRRTINAVFGSDNNFNLLFSSTGIKISPGVKDSPDIVLLDILLPLGNGLDFIHKIRQRYPKTKVIIFTDIVDPNITALAFHKGVDGYLLKSDDYAYLKSSLRMAISGGKPIAPLIASHILNFSTSVSLKELCPSLTEREVLIINYLKAGIPNKVLSFLMNISTNTVNFHLKNIYKKLYINSKAELILMVGNSKS